VDMRVMKNKRGDSMCFVTLDDRSGRMEVALFADVYNEFFQAVEKDKLLIVEVNVSNDEYSGGLKSICRSVKDIDEARAHYARVLRIKVDGKKHDETLCDELKQLLQPLENGCPVVIEFFNAMVACDIQLGSAWRISPSDEQLHKLRNQYGKDAVTLVF